MISPVRSLQGKESDLTAPEASISIAVHVSRREPSLCNVSHRGRPCLDMATFRDVDPLGKQNENEMWATMFFDLIKQANTNYLKALAAAAMQDGDQAWNRYTEDLAFEKDIDALDRFLHFQGMNSLRQIVQQ